jgi:hypothetical protein
VLPEGDEFGLQFVKAGVEVGDGGGHESSFVLRGGETGRFYPKSSWFKNKRPNWTFVFRLTRGGLVRAKRAAQFDARTFDDGLGSMIYWMWRRVGISRIIGQWLDAFGIGRITNYSELANRWGMR